MKPACRATVIRTDKREEHTIENGVYLLDDGRIGVPLEREPDWVDAGSDVVVADETGSVERAFTIGRVRTILIASVEGATYSVYESTDFSS